MIEILCENENKSVEKRTPIRDSQMAKNLDFHIQEMPETSLSFGCTMHE